MEKERVFYRGDGIEAVDFKPEELEAHFAKTPIKRLEQEHDELAGLVEEYVYNLQLDDTSEYVKEIILKRVARIDKVATQYDEFLNEFYQPNLGKGVMQMEVRFFFKDGSQRDIKIQTYYPKGDDQCTVITHDGDELELTEVKEMIKIK